MVASLADAALWGVYAVLGLGLAIPAAHAVRAASAPLLAGLSAAAAALFTGSALALLQATASGPVYYHGGLVVHDSFTAFILAFAGVASILALWASGEEPGYWPASPAFHGLIPVILFGIFYMAGAADALVFLAAWLVVSVASYVVVATPGDRDSRAAAARYVLMGSLATLLVAAWLGIHAGLVSRVLPSPSLALAAYPPGGLAVAASALLLAGVGFKVGVFPFHWWLPSVYARADGRPVAVVAAVAKLGFVAFLARFFYTASQAAAGASLAPLAAVLAVATMTYGNLAALTARDLQTLLAYSSIAHVGYLLAGVAAAAYLAPVDPATARLAMAAVAIHSAAYALAKATLFPLAPEVGRGFEGLRGLPGRSGAAAVSSGVLVLSLLGLPPLLGFWGKLLIILASAKYSVPLAVAVAVNTGISSAYYVALLREMWQPDGAAARPPARLEAALLAAALATVAFGLLAIPLIPAASP